MIVFRTPYARLGEALFGEPADGAPLDVVHHLQRPTPLAGAACRPFKTLHVDLSADEAAIFAGFKKGNRYEIRRAEQDGVVCETHTAAALSEFEVFFDRFAKAKAIAGVPTKQLAAYADAGALDLSSARDVGGERIVWHLHLVGQRRARLFMSATSVRDGDKARRALIGRANRLLHWRDITRLRAAGCTIYDLGGWDGASADPELRGISRFKEEFGGRVVEEYNCVEVKTLRGRVYRAAEHLVAELRSRDATQVRPQPPGWELLRCPRDAATLAEDGPAGLRCTTCSAHYPIEDGIVRFVTTDEDLDSADKRSEMQARDEEAERYDARFSAVRNAIEVPPSLAALAAAPDDRVVELGCGSGRMTLQYLDRVAFVVAIDFSLASLRVLQRKIPAADRGRVLLVQADLCRLPLAPHAFSKVVSYQVFEHLPSDALRVDAARAAHRALRPGGIFVLSVYNWCWNKQRLAARGIGDNTAKQGFHRGANPVYYFNFEPDDVRALFADAGFTLERLQGLDLQVPLIDRIGRLAVAVNRVAERTPFGLRHGHLLLARGSAL